MINQINKQASILGVAKRSLYRWKNEGVDIQSLVKNYHKDDWLKPRQVANLLGMSRSAIYRWMIETDVFEIIKIHTRYRISKRSVEKLLHIIGSSNESL